MLQSMNVVQVEFWRDPLVADEYITGYFVNIGVIRISPACEFRVEIVVVTHRPIESNFYDCHSCVAWI